MGGSYVGRNDDPGRGANRPAIILAEPLPSALIFNLVGPRTRRIGGVRFPSETARTGARPGAHFRAYRPTRRRARFRSP
jgi:hypothetical protein